jgi:hypothetical protein
MRKSQEIVMIKLGSTSLHIASIVRIALVATLCVLLVAPADAKKKGGGTVPLQSATAACNRTAGCTYDTRCFNGGTCTTVICTPGKTCVSCNDPKGTCPAIVKRGPTGPARAGGATTVATRSAGGGPSRGATKPPIGNVGAVRAGKH